MTSRRQRARARRTEQFWRDKAARACTPFDRAQVAYDRARAAVQDLPPPDRPDGWQRLESALTELHERWADERARNIWRRLAQGVSSPRQRVWTAWRRMWAVVHRSPEAHARWQEIADCLTEFAVTLSDFGAVSNSERQPGPAEGSTPSRGPAGVPLAGARAKRSTTPPNSAPKTRSVTNDTEGGK